MHTLEALRLIALKGAVKPDAESNVRYVMRWYSKTFHTPLHVVEAEIPLEDLWLAFFEERYHNYDPETLEEEVAKLLETPEQRKEREMAEESEKAAETEFVKLAEQANQVKKKVDEAAEKMKLAAGMLSTNNLPETQRGILEPLEPDIQMEFVDDADMEKLLSGGMNNQTKTPPVDPMSFK